jgi:hypothetical protein
MAMHHRSACRTIVFTAVLLLSPRTDAQVLISLLFGDNLNTGKIEFGLEGGATFSTIGGLPGAQYKSGFNLGFYFDIKTRSRWKIATGVMVKSPWGAAGLPVYPTGDAALDTAFIGGSVERRLNYFNVPIMAKYSFGRFFAMAGPQLSLGYQAADVFTKSVKDDADLTYRLENRALYKPLDAGVVAAVGMHVQKGYGMNLIIRYYQGFMEIRKDALGDAQVNQGWHLLVGIPIGMGKAQERMRQKELEQGK